MSWVEFIDSSQAVSVDYAHNLRGVRIYKVWSYSRTQILTNPASIQNDVGVGLPILNSSWEGMKLDRYDVSPGPGNVFIVQGLYSNNGRFLGFLPPSFASAGWQVTFQTIVHETEIGVPTQLVVGDAGGVQALIGGYERKPWRVFSTGIRYSRKVDINKELVDQMLSALAAQNNKLHIINGAVYRFEAGDAIENRQDNWITSYSWIYDAGIKTADLRIPSAPKNIYPTNLSYRTLGGEFPYLGAIWTMPPFHEVALIPSAFIPLPGVVLPPTFEAACPYSLDATGWSTLPLAFP